jgi:hypothetical protein
MSYDVSKATKGIRNAAMLFKVTDATIIQGHCCTTVNQDHFCNSVMKAMTDRHGQDRKIFFTYAKAQQTVQYLLNVRLYANLFISWKWILIMGGGLTSPTEYPAPGSHTHRHSILQNPEHKVHLPGHPASCIHTRSGTPLQGRGNNHTAA